MCVIRGGVLAGTTILQKYVVMKPESGVEWRA